ncbi:MAG: PAS domain S-box protein [Firmicutes bacterium]|nr:PAS domain S-box protein [Bacillota bacterium]
MSTRQNDNVKEEIQILRQRILELESELQDSRDRFQGLVESSNALIWEMDSSKELVYLSPQVWDLLGYQTEEVFEKRFLKRFDKEYTRKVVRIMDAAIKRKKAFTLYEVKLRHKDGSLRIFEISGRPTFDRDGVFTGFLGVGYEITKRRLAEDALRDTNQRLADIINFLPDPTLVIDMEGRVIAWNQAIEDMTGFKAEDMLGKGDYEYSIPFYGHRRPILIDLVFEIDPEIESEYFFIRKDRQVVIAESYTPCVKGVGATLWGKATPLCDSRGNFVGAIESIRDISDTKQAEKERLETQERIAHAEKLVSLGIMAAGIAHEINQPLNSLKVIADSLLYWYKRGKDLDMVRVAESLQKISNQAERIDNYIKNIRSSIRTEQRPHSEYCSFNDAIENALVMLGETIKKNRIRVAKSLDPGLPPILSQPARMEEIIINLVLNSIQSIAESGRMERRIECRTELKDQIQIEISDNGIGLSQEVRARAFEPFFTTRPGGEGMGLGLAIVHSIVTSYGGSIEADRNEWGGATFRIRIPWSINNRS